MKYVRIPHPFFGFRCAGCGRSLEEMPAWCLGKERFYCSVHCRDVDEADLAASPAAESPVG